MYNDNVFGYFFCIGKKEVLLTRLEEYRRKLTAATATACGDNDMTNPMDEQCRLLLSKMQRLRKEEQHRLKSIDAADADDTIFASLLNSSSSKGYNNEINEEKGDNVQQLMPISDVSQTIVLQRRCNPNGLNGPAKRKLTTQSNTWLDISDDEEEEE
jgi:hypothetical protein